MQSITSNLKMYFGPDIPTLFMREGSMSKSMVEVETVQALDPESKKK